MASSTSAPSGRGKRQRSRQPDWEDFYKNGVPKEIIVIDDDTPPVQPKASQGRTNNNTRAAASHGTGQPANKKRRTAQGNGYESVHAERPSYSLSHQAHDDSGSYPSTDRTTSLHTTAPTSLGSNSGSGVSNGTYYETAQPGEKRKRVTRKGIRDEAKKRELEQVSDAFESYIPPPKPPIKASEVHVPVIRDNYKNQKVDDEDGHYIVIPEASITERYEIVRLLGQGTFGKVVEAIDKRRRTRVAIKIIRSVQKYRDASRIELRVLSTLSSNDKSNRNKCIHLRDTFDFRNHICIVTDLLGQSVFDFLKANAFTPFPSTHIQNFARQLFTSVACKSIVFCPRT